MGASYMDPIEFLLRVCIFHGGTHFAIMACMGLGVLQIGTCLGFGFVQSFDRDIRLVDTFSAFCILGNI